MSADGICMIYPGFLVWPETKHKLVSHRTTSWEERGETGARGCMKLAEASLWKIRSGPMEGRKWKSSFRAACGVRDWSNVSTKYVSGMPLPVNKAYRIINS